MPSRRERHPALSVPSGADAAGRLTVGWREWVALPELGIPAVKAKVDTGARTSALHASELETFEADGVERVRFLLRPLRRRPEPVLACEATVVERRVVTDSGGHREERPVIVTSIALGGRTWPMELTLTRRDTMLFRMLLGRTAMAAGALLVDPAGSYRTGRELARAYEAGREGGEPREREPASAPAGRPGPGSR